MLVIRRRAGESILIGDDIEVQVAEIGANRVKLSISAPGPVTVLRKELKLTRDQNLASAHAVEPNVLSQLAERLRGTI